jgi:hypothetical protein
MQTYKQSWISSAPTTAAAVTATNEVEYEFRFQHPFTANITGLTGCGDVFR